MQQKLLQSVQQTDFRSVARAISLIENETPGYAGWLQTIPAGHAAVIGITGPPGAGKSTLTDGLIEELLEQKNKIAVLCVDPSSPFNRGALLGDRIRMSRWYTHPAVFIRSLASRGSVGGLHPKIIEITDLLQAASFDYIIIETVGVGQSEIEIAALADVTVVVLVPEAGDEIQTMKAGLMEIADVFVVNKSDRPDADAFVNNLKLMLAPAFGKKEHELPVVKTVASQNKGVHELYEKIKQVIQGVKTSDKKYWLLAEKAYQLIQNGRMKDVLREELLNEIKKQYRQPDFNIYKFAQSYDRSL